MSFPVFDAYKVTPAPVGASCRTWQPCFASPDPDACCASLAANPAGAPCAASNYCQAGRFLGLPFDATKACDAQPPCKLTVDPAACCAWKRDRRCPDAWCASGVKKPTRAAAEAAAEATCARWAPCWAAPLPQACCLTKPNGCDADCFNGAYVGPKPRELPIRQYSREGAECTGQVLPCRLHPRPDICCMYKPAGCDPDCVRGEFKGQVAERLRRRPPAPPLPRQDPPTRPPLPPAARPPTAGAKKPRMPALEEMTTPPQIITPTYIATPVPTPVPTYAPTPEPATPEPATAPPPYEVDCAAQPSCRYANDLVRCCWGKPAGCDSECDMLRSYGRPLIGAFPSKTTYFPPAPRIIL